ncbi:MAG TPA: transposase [Vicinamibacterales bacterium]|nr:transposase [Vicinamibacterales bacterium]
MKHRRPPRLPRESYLGAARIFLTMCTFERNQYFRDAARAEQVRSQLLQTALDYGVDVIAYCLMWDHVHALFTGLTESADNRMCADRFRQISSFHFGRSFASTLWQEGYYDRALRDEESTLDVVAYIVLNPVRAGLCARAIDYPYVGSSRYSVAELVTATEWRPHDAGLKPSRYGP